MTGTRTISRALQLLVVAALGAVLAMGSFTFLSPAGANDDLPQSTERIGQTTLYAQDMNEMIDFYVEQLGFDELYRFNLFGDTYFATLQKQDLYLTFSSYTAIHEFTDLERVRRSPLRSFEIAMLVDEPQEVIDWVGDMAADGVRVLQEPTVQPWGETSAYVADPEGNLVQISTHNE